MILADFWIPMANSCGYECRRCGRRIGSNTILSLDKRANDPSAHNCWPEGASDERIRAAFKRRFGYDPREIETERREWKLRAETAEAKVENYERGIREAVRFQNETQAQPGKPRPEEGQWVYELDLLADDE